jgi:osmoprotectant transport system permease protein
MSDSLAELFADLPYLLGGHLLLSVSAIGIGVAISVPLGVAAARSERLRGPVVTAAGVVQTIPSLALLALMVPLLGGTIGFRPAFFALTLYSILPTLRNTVTGILEVDPAVTEAARGMGMTDRQSLLRVELPLAAPVVIAGIRTATVWVVGTATLATPVGAPCLGHYIFLGLQTRNWDAVLFGCVFVALLAILLDQLVHALEVAARTRNRRLGWAAMALLAGISIGGIAPLGFDSLARSGGERVASVQPPIAGHEQRLLEGQTLAVGSKGFTEQYIVAALLERQLALHGAQVRVTPNMGSTILFDALRNDTVDVYVDYSGTIWTTLMKREDPIGRTEMGIEVAKYLKDEFGVIAVGPLGFENAYALAMRRDRAAALGARSIGDLGPHAGALSVGGDPEVFGRPEWIRVRSLYGLERMRTRGMDSTFMYGAVRDGEVDVITAYSTDGRIAAYDLLVLRDPKQAFPPYDAPYDAILLVSPRAAKTPGVIEALRPLVNAIGDETMRQANRLVDIDGLSPGAVAERLGRRIEGAHH